MLSWLKGGARSFLRGLSRTPISSAIANSDEGPLFRAIKLPMTNSLVLGALLEPTVALKKIATTPVLPRAEASGCSKMSMMMDDCVSDASPQTSLQPESGCPMEECCPCDKHQLASCKGDDRLTSPPSSRPHTCSGSASSSPISVLPASAPPEVHDSDCEDNVDKGKPSRFASCTVSAGTTCYPYTADYLIDFQSPIGQGLSALVCKGELDGQPVAWKVWYQYCKKDAAYMFHPEVRPLAEYLVLGYALAELTIRDDHVGDGTVFETLAVAMEVAAYDQGYAIFKGNIYHSSEGQLHEETILSHLYQMTTCLRALHDRGLTFGDLKPGNILIMADGTIKLADLEGIRRVNGNGYSLYVEGQGLIYTLEYCDEEAMEAGYQSRATDIYSLGMIINDILEECQRAGGKTDTEAFRWLQGKFCTWCLAKAHHRPDIAQLQEAVRQRLEEMELWPLQHVPVSPLHSSGGLTCRSSPSVPTSEP